MRQVDFIWQHRVTGSVAGPRRSFKALPKAKLAPKKKKKAGGWVIVTVWWSIAGLIQYSFMNSSETIATEKSAQQIDEMYQKLQYLQPPLVNRKGPVLLCKYAQLCITQRTLEKLNELGYEVLPHLPHSPDLSPTDYHLFNHLNNVLQGKCFHK